MSADADVRLDAALKGGEPELFEARDLQGEARAERDAVQRGRAAPQGETALEGLGRLGVVALAERLAAFVDGLLEEVGVHGAGAQVEPVATARGDQDVLRVEPPVRGP